MIDAATFRKLLAILRLGESDQFHEADAALRKGVEMMVARGVTMDALLERIRPSDLPQSVCAELARRYYEAQSNLSSSERQTRYQRAFAVIARKYAPDEFRETKSTGTTSGAGQGRSDPDPDWVNRMDERRRRQGAQGNGAQSGARPSGEKGSQERRQPWWQWPTKPVWRFPEIRSEFLAYAIRSPIRAIHFFAVCFLSSLIPGILFGIAIGGVLDYYRIHIFDNLHWTTVLGISMFPFMVRRGRGLYRRGWFHW